MRECLVQGLNKSLIHSFYKYIGPDSVMDSTTDFGSVGQGSNPCRGTKTLYRVSLELKSHPFSLIREYITRKEKHGGSAGFEIKRA